MSAYNDEPVLEPPISQSKVKLVKNTKGVNWEITVVEGAEDAEIERLRNIATKHHDALLLQFPE